MGNDLDAEIDIMAIAGIGLTQNANAREKWQMGKLTLPDYFNRTMETDEKHLWDREKNVPDLVVISLGGNDYNH